jgi:hypothetical protein
MRQGFDGARLGQARRTLDQQMTVPEEGDQEPLDELVLTDDLARQIVLEMLYGRAYGLRLPCRVDTGERGRSGVDHAVLIRDGIITPAARAMIGLLA